MCSTVDSNFFSHYCLLKVPPELRMSANVPQQTSQDAPKNIPAKEQTKKDWVGVHFVFRIWLDGFST